MARSDDDAALHRARREILSIAAGEAETRRRLEPEDVWLQPLVAPGMDERTAGWDTSLPDWLTSLLQRFSPKTQRPEVDALDDPGNRIWLSLLAAARPLDPVLEEFGLEGSAAPAFGGGRYGLQPKTAEQLDPSGELTRLWRRYRLAHRRYEALASAVRPA